MGLGDKSCEALLILTVDEDGCITRMDEFLDPGMCAEPRPAPQPATPPSAVQHLGGTHPCEETNLAIIAELFDSIVAHVDVSHLFAEGAVAAQFIASTKGKFHKIRP